ncbi:hypothetical protein CsSME_00040669 [Camellia sinensis var. sinensis]
MEVKGPLKVTIGLKELHICQRYSNVMFRRLTCKTLISSIMAMNLLHFHKNTQVVSQCQYFLSGG